MRRSIVILAAAIALTAVITLVFQHNQGDEGGNTPNTAWLQGFATGALARLVPADPAKPLPGRPFLRPDGAPAHFADFKGKVLVVNFWATWCAPCREEMPALGRLAEALKGKPAEVIAISIDRGGVETAKAFLDEVGVALPAYTDPGGPLSREMGIFGLPVTLIVDENGYELARHSGPAAWDAPASLALINAVLNGAPPPSPAAPPAS